MSIFAKLLEKSWATPGYAGEVSTRAPDIAPAAKTCLFFLMAVLTSMFFLFIVGYRIRMTEADWVPISDPALLWFNTALLIVAGWLMQRSRQAAREGMLQPLRTNLTLAGLVSLLFLAGQYLAWQQLSAAGYYVVTSPAAAFFALLTALHAVHLCGGLLVWLRSAVQAWRGAEIVSLKLTIELTTTYWHFLLLVWLVFFTLLLTT